MVFFFEANFWNSVTFFSLVLTWFGILVFAILYVIYRLYWQYDAGVYIEKACGGVFYRGTRARVWEENGVRKIKLFRVKHKTHPAPTLDAIMPGNRGNRVECVVDIYGNWHQVRPKTRYIPILIDDDRELKQLCIEQPVEEERKKGWFSKLKNMFVREIQVYDKKSNSMMKEMIGLYEVAMDVDDTVDKAWAYQEWMNNFNKHVSDVWEKIKGPVVFGSIIIFGIVALFLTGYFMMKISEHTVTSCGSAQAETIGNVLADRLGIAGIGPPVVNSSVERTNTGFVIEGNPLKQFVNTFGGS